MKPTMPRAGLVLLLLIARSSGSVAEEPRVIPAEQFDAIHRLIKRQRGEWAWADLPWTIRFADAQRRSITEGKPIFVVMAAQGSVLGCA